MSFDSAEAEAVVAPLSEEYQEYIENGGESDSGYVPSSLDLSYLSEKAADYESDIDIPESYDLRDYGRVGAIEDQGSEGTCWAFAATCSAESTIIEQFPDIDFSVRHLAWSTYTGDDEYAMYQVSDYINNGGGDFQAIGSLAAWKGFAFTADYPYTYDYEFSESDRYVSEYHLQDAYILSDGSYSIRGNAPSGTSN